MLWSKGGTELRLTSPRNIESVGDPARVGYAAHPFASANPGVRWYNVSLDNMYNHSEKCVHSLAFLGSW